MVKETCGIFIFNKEGELLICHPTKHPENVWSIPKGMRDEGETQWAAAKRETYEETNIVVSSLDYDVVKLPDIMYRSKRKKLISFVIFLKNDFPKDFDFKCHTLVRTGEFYEVDDWKWYSVEIANSLLHEAQKEALSHLKK